MGSEEVTAADREKAMRALGFHSSWSYVDPMSASSREDVDNVAQALADERAKARAQVAWDLRDLVNDSGGDVWARAVLDFADGLDEVRET